MERTRWKTINIYIYIEEVVQDYNMLPHQRVCAMYKEQKSTLVKYEIIYYAHPNTQIN